MPTDGASRTRGAPSRWMRRWSSRPVPTCSRRAHRAAIPRGTPRPRSRRGRTDRDPAPPSAAVPPGFVFVPEARRCSATLTPSGCRHSLFAEPEHAVQVASFLIGEHEVTNAEYLDFLVSPGRRTRRTPPAHGRPECHLRLRRRPFVDARRNTARRGEPFCRPKRAVRRCQDWLRFPVAGIAWEDAQAYAAWLAAARPRRAPLLRARVGARGAWRRRASLPPRRCLARRRRKLRRDLRRGRRADGRRRGRVFPDRRQSVRRGRPRWERGRVGRAGCGARLAARGARRPLGERGNPRSPRLSWRQRHCSRQRDWAARVRGRPEDAVTFTSGRSRCEGPDRNRRIRGSVYPRIERKR